MPLPNSPGAIPLSYGTIAGVWLTSYDPNGQWPAVEVALESPAQIGDRSDWAWVVLSTPILLGDTERSRLLVGARHEGDDVWSQPKRWPMHVYVCTVQPEREASGLLNRDEVTIAAWGLLHESGDRADHAEF